MTTKSKTRKPAVNSNRKIPAHLRCTLCGNGKFVDTVIDYKIKGTEMTVLNVPCRKCDTCDGRQYDPNKLFPAVNYIRFKKVAEVEFDTAVRGNKELNEEIKERDRIVEEVKKASKKK